METSARSTRELAQERVVMAAVLLLTALVYAPSLGFGFVEWDDPMYLTRNPLVVDAEHASTLDQLLTPRLGYPIPVTVASYRIEHALFGLTSALPYHASNVLLHLLAVACVFGIGRRASLSVTASALAAVVFGLHPAVAESVSWLTGRKDVLSAAATFGALFFALAPATERGGDRAPSRALAASAVLCVLAVLSKPTGACATLVAACAVWLRRPSRDGVVLAARTYVLPAVIVLASIPVALQNHGAIHGHRDVHGLQLLREAWYALGYHLGIVAMVRPNAAKYLPTPWPPSFDPWVDLLPFVALVLAILAYRKHVAREPRLLAARLGAVLAIAAYLPSANLIPLTRVVADAYVHTSLAGIGLLLGAMLDALAERGVVSRPALRHAPALAVLALAAGLSLRAHASSARFTDSFSVWSATYAAFPHDYRLCRNAGNGLYERFGPTPALEWYDGCVARHGAEPFDRNRALVLVELGRLDQAEPILRRVLARAPDDRVIAQRLQAVERARNARNAAAPEPPDTRTSHGSQGPSH